MATTVFTSWASVRDFLLDKLAASDPSVGRVRVGNKEITYWPEKLERMLAYAKQRAVETGTTYSIGDGIRFQSRVKDPSGKLTKNGCISVDTAGVALYFGSRQVLPDLPPRIAFEMNV